MFCGSCFCVSFVQVLFFLFVLALVLCCCWIVVGVVLVLFLFFKMFLLLFGGFEGQVRWPFATSLGLNPP